MTFIDGGLTARIVDVNLINSPVHEAPPQIEDDAAGCILFRIGKDPAFESVESGIDVQVKASKQPKSPSDQINHLFHP